MIDPNNITKFYRTEAELEEFLLFCIIVAGKNSKIQAKKLAEFLEGGDILGPLPVLKSLMNLICCLII